MNCYRCGAQLPEGAKVCAVCGTPIDEKNQNESNNAGEKISAKRLTIGALAAVMVIAALAAVIVAVKSANMRLAPQPEPGPEPERKEHEGIRLPASLEATSEAIEAAQPESESIITESETEDESGAEESWISVVDRYKKVECVIPKSFERVRDDWGETVLVSPEGDCSIRVAVIEGTQFENAADALNLWRGEMTGRIEIYAEAGEGWYEAEFADGRETVHRKCFVESDCLRYFEFQFPTEKEEYRESIAYMTENFQLTPTEEEETVIGD